MFPLNVAPTHVCVQFLRPVAPPTRRVTTIKASPFGYYVVAKPRVISTITVTPASFLLCQYRRHDPGRHLCVNTSTFFSIPYGMPQLNVVRSRSPVFQVCIANCGVPCSVSTGRPPASRPFYHLVTVISITFRRFFFRLPLEG